MDKTLHRVVLAISLAWPLAAQAGGLYRYEIGTADIGFASAGTAARAEDASTRFANPVAMTRLAGNYGYFKLEHERLGGGSGSEDEGDWDFGARLGVLYEPGTNTRFGLTWVSEAEYEFDVNGSVTIDPPGPLAMPGSAARASR